MRKITFIKWPCQLFALALVLFLFSCGNRNDLPVNGDGAGTAADPASGSRYILASSLALAAEIGKPESDKEALRALHRVSREETAEATNYTFISCCCPCYQVDAETTSAIRPADDGTSTDTAIMEPQSITRRDSTGHCPCPTMMEIIAKNAQKMSAVLDGTDLTSEEQTGEMQGWTVFKIDEKTLTPGKHTLELEGVFFGTESRTYVIPLLIDRRKPYFLYK